MKKTSIYQHIYGCSVLVLILSAIGYEYSHQASSVVRTELIQFLNLAQKSMDIAERDYSSSIKKSLQIYPQYSVLADVLHQTKQSKDSIIIEYEEGRFDMNQREKFYFPKQLDAIEIDSAPLFRAQEIYQMKTQNKQLEYDVLQTNSIEKWAEILKKATILDFSYRHVDFVQELTFKFGFTQMCGFGCFSLNSETENNFVRVGHPLKVKLYMQDACITDQGVFDFYIQGKKLEQSGYAFNFSVKNSKKGVVHIPYCMDYTYRGQDRVLAGQLLGKYGVWVE